MTKPACVFLLGAGASFSYDSKLPLMRGFVEGALKANLKEHKKQSTKKSTAQAYHREFRAHYQSVKDFYRHILKESKRSQFVLGREFDNLEVLFTQADLQRTISAPNAAKLFEDFSWVVWDSYCRFDGSPPYGELCDRVIEQLDLYPVFITTNYDLLLEREFWNYQMPSGKKHGKYARFSYPGFQNFHSAEKHVIRFDPDNNHRFLRQLETQYNATAKLWEIPIIKLHGSASWFELENHDWIGASKFFGTDRFDLHSFRQDVCNVMRNDVVRPAIIPPVLSKSALNDVISSQWMAAIEYIKKAKYIISIGYSFPITDAFMQRLISQGLLGNNSLEAFFVVDKSCKKADRKERKQRYGEMFGKSTNRVYIGEFDTGASRFFSRFTKNPETMLSRKSWQPLRSYLK